MPPPQPLLRWGGGHPLPTPYPPRRKDPPPRRLDSRAFVARRSCSFSFTTRTLGPAHFQDWGDNPPLSLMRRIAQDRSKWRQLVQTAMLTGGRATR